MPVYGHPDNDPHQVPYGESLVDETGIVVTSGNVTSRGPFAVAGYHALVVTVDNGNTGLAAVSLTWDFRDSVGQSASSRSFTVPGNTARRVLYQNQGDRLIDIAFEAQGGDLNLDVYVAGSHLLPFSGGHDWAVAWSDPALGDANQTIPNNAATAVTFHHFKSAGTSLSFDTANSRIVPGDTGLYQVVGVIHWPTGAGNFQHQAQALMSPGAASGSLNEFMNPAGAGQAPFTPQFDDEAITYHLVENLSGIDYFELRGYQTSGVNQVLTQTRRLLVRRVGNETEVSV